MLRYYPPPGFRRSRSRSAENASLQKLSSIDCYGWLRSWKLEKASGARGGIGGAEWQSHDISILMHDNVNDRSSPVYPGDLASPIWIIRSRTWSRLGLIEEE